MARQSFLKKRKKEILIILAILITIVVGYFISKQQTQILHEEIYTTTVRSESYVFKEEEYVLLDDENIKFDVKEGTKVGANTLLSQSYKLNTNRYIKEAIKVIDWRLKNKSYNNRNKYITNLRKLDAEIAKLEKKVESTENKEDQTEYNKAKKKLDKTKENRDLMQKSLKYMIADTKTLNSIKQELKSKLNNFDKKLTVSNLNFSYTGYIYFSTTGYESVLDKNALNVLSNDYLNYIREFKPEKQNSKGTIVKIVNNDAAYICSFVDTDQYIFAEKTTTKMKKNLAKKVNFDKVGGYYEYLERRVDILKSFPTISFENTEGTIVTGYLIDVHKKDHKKALIICVKDGINNVINHTRTTYKLHTEQISAFAIPKRAIVDIDGETYVSVMTTGRFKELVKIKVFKYKNGKAFLKPYENPEIKENMEIILNPN